jgi:hypothetical protein
MNIKESVNIEKKLTITETDIVNGGEALVLIAYAVKENDNLYAFPAPQIFNESLYSAHKTEYDQKIMEFRSKCV